ncbi:MAG TPA: hypothetical protein VN258_04845 [Mobilitalea sp.]|nr:hypothetical protein [Mobilitalea sp.]
MYNGGKAIKKTFEEINENLYSSGWKSQFMSGLMMPIMNFKKADFMQSSITVSLNRCHK